MKIQITFKDPDVVYDAFEEAKNKLVKQLMKELELDDETGTASVVIAP